MLRIVILGCLLAQAFSWSALAQDAAQRAAPAISLTQDLRANAREAASARVPLAVFFSQDGCPYCEQARRDYLAPMAADPASRDRVRIVEVEVTAQGTLADFSGQRVSPSALARARGVRTVPTVLFLGARGETLAAPLVGLTVPDFYQSYLERRIEEARARVRAP
ncbi:MAG TPA: thioredoxin fold domain-containing protein [Burkholderiales bacterium]